MSDLAPDRAMSETAMLASLREIHLPDVAPAGMAADIAATVGLAALAALLVAGLLCPVSLRRAPAPRHDLKAELARLKREPDAVRSVALLHLLRAMAALGRVDTCAGSASLWAVLAAAALAVIALSGPAIERRDTLSFRNFDGVLFLVDASPSVTEHPRWPQMLTMGRFGLASLGTRPGGLTVFAGDAYVASDMTLDHLQLGQTFSLLASDTVPDPGSRPERALTLAADLLREAQVTAGDVLLLTDGGGLGTASLQAAVEIAGQGARLSLVSLTEPAPDAATHASVGGGTIFTLDQTDALADWLGTSVRTRLERQDYPLLYWTDLGRYLLALALLPLLLLFRRPA